MGTRFGDYEVLSPVAEGSTGRVFKASHIGLDRVAAIKELSPALRGRPGVVEQLRSEARVLAGLSHPNIVDLYDFVEEPDRVWLAEQWVDGASLATILDRHGPITPEQSVGVVRGAMTGLAHAHERGIVHRDVSASNILADLGGTSMLVDFGMAGPAGTGTGSATGTPAFLSPEAARGEVPGKPGDVYSAAAVLYLLLTGRPVFAGSAPQVVRQHVEADPPRLTGHGADLAELIARSLAKDPASRPQDAGEFLAALEQAARRRFGEAWLQRASIAGVVGTVVAGAGVAAAGGAATGVAAQTVVVDAALGALKPPPAPTGAGRPARSFAVKAGVVVGGVVVAVGAATGAVLASGSDTGDEAPAVSEADAGDSGDPAPAEPTAAVDPVLDLAPAGTWTLRSETVRSTNHEYFPVGDKQTRTWRLKLDCVDESSCGGDIKSSSGTTFDYTWDGKSLTVLREDEFYEGPCSDPQGKNVPGSHYREDARLPDVVLRPTRYDAQGQPVAFKGNSVVKHLVSEVSQDCVNSYAETGAANPTVTEAWTLQAR